MDNFSHTKIYTISVIVLLFFILSTMIPSAVSCGSEDDESNECDNGDNETNDETDNGNEEEGKTKKGFTPNYPPVADASAGEPYIGFIQEHITLNGTKSYDPDGRIVEWIWDFGDGTTGEGELSAHSYSKPDIYSVILTVKDNRGATDSDETQVVALVSSPQSKI